MYEVEIKSKLKDRETVVAKLESLGCKFGPELHQADHVFTPKGTFLPRSPLGSPALRVRKQNDKYIFTLKISQSNHQDSIEREMEIGDGKMMIEILELMKWNKMPIVEKRRIKTNFKDMEIVLDTVENLGEFIEAEKIVTEESREARAKIQEELLDFLETVGIPREDQIIDGKYDIMLYEKLNGR